MSGEDITIKVGDRTAVTTLMAAALLEITPGRLRSALREIRVKPIADLDQRTPLYDRDELLRRMALRPGRGANLRRRAASTNAPAVAED